VKILKLYFERETLEEEREDLLAFLLGEVLGSRPNRCSTVKVQK